MSNVVLVSDNEKLLRTVYTDDVVEKLKEISDLYDTVVSSENAHEHMKALEEADFLFSTWGVPVFEEEIIDKMKNLKCFFYAASSVRRFAEPYMNRGIKIVNAGKANGDFVAKFTYAEIFLAAKGFFNRLRIGDAFASESAYEETPPAGCYDQKIGIIGAGNIGREVIKMLREDDLKIEFLVYDPFLSDEAAEEMGVTKATLDEIFSQCLVISNHAPSIDATRHMIKKEHFEMMRKGATFINTGRGDILDEDEFCEVFSKRKDIVAVLDVVIVEPLPEESPINRLDNVFRTPHIAGVLGNETKVMAYSCIDEMRRFEKGEPLQAEITAELFARMG